MVTPFLTLVATQSILAWVVGEGVDLHIEVETCNVDGQVTALGSAGPFTLVVDRPLESGGGGLGFNGGQLLYLAVAGCISNDLFRDARTAGIELSHARVKVGGDFVGELAISDEIRYEVEVAGDASEEPSTNQPERSTA